MKNADLKKRILDISYKHKLSHLGSCLTAVDIIEDIYKNKKPEDKFVLSAGHAGLALYVVIEKHLGINAEDIFLHHGVHPDRCAKCHLDASTGSLGHGLGIAIGMALAEPQNTIHCLISDGECAEGSIWEGLRFRARPINLELYFNLNNYSAYSYINDIELRLQIEFLTSPINTHIYHMDFFNEEEFPFQFLGKQEVWHGLSIMDYQSAHYHVMSEEDYKLGISLCYV